MKKICLAWFCLFFLVQASAFAETSPVNNTKCKCDTVTLRVNGRVNFFLCLMPDSNAIVRLYDSKRKLLGIALTSADGRYGIVARVYGTPCYANCCIYTETIMVKSANCYAGVLGLRGESVRASVSVVDPCQKSAIFNLPIICEYFTACGNH
jgi:hypothetical protein